MVPGGLFILSLRSQTRPPGGWLALVGMPLVGPYQAGPGALTLGVDLQRPFQVFDAVMRPGNGSQDQPGLLQVRRQRSRNLAPMAGSVFIAAL